jgi:hypothetical protein
MIDFNNPAPWLMTTFEKCGFYAGLLGLAWTAFQDWRARRAKKE